MTTIDLSTIPTHGRQVLRVAEQLSGLVGNPKYGICVNQSTLSAIFVSGDGSIFVRADIDIDEKIEEFNLYFERLLDSNMNAVEVFEHNVFSSIGLVSPLIKKLETFDEYFTFLPCAAGIPKLNPSRGEIRLFDVPSGDVRLGFDGRTFLLDGEEVHATFNLSLESVSFDVVIDGTILHQLADKGELRISFSQNWLNFECLMLGGVIRGMMAYQEEEPEEDNIVHFPTPEPESEPKPEVVWGGDPLLPVEFAERLPYLGNADEEAIMQVRYHYPPTGWEWYASEFDPSSEKFFGFVFGDFDEWSHFSLDELYQNQVSFDREFTPKTLKEIQAIKALAAKLESKVTFADNSPSPTPSPTPAQNDPWLEPITKVWGLFEEGILPTEAMLPAIAKHVPGLSSPPLDSLDSLIGAIREHLKPQMALMPLSSEQQQELYDFLATNGGDRFLAWFEPAKKPAKKTRKSAAAAMPSTPSLRVPVETVQRGSRQEALLLFLRQGRTRQELADEFGAYSGRIAEIRKKGYEIKFIDDRFYFEGEIFYAQ